MADYMKSLRRHSVAQAATEAARRVSQEPSDTEQAAGVAAPAAEAQAAESAASDPAQSKLPPPHAAGRQAPQQQRRRHSQPYPDPFAAAGAAPPVSAWLAANGRLSCKCLPQSIPDKSAEHDPQDALCSQQ